MKSAWRLLNSSVLLLSMGMPWTYVYGDSITGAGIIKFIIWGLGYAASESLHEASLLVISLMALTFILVLLALAGLLGVSFYACLSALYAIGFRSSKSRPVLLLALILGILAISLVGIDALRGYGGIGRLQYGFWLASIAAMSSGILEYIESAVRKELMPLGNEEFAS